MAYRKSLIAFTSLLSLAACGESNQQPAEGGGNPSGESGTAGDTSSGVSPGDGGGSADTGPTGRNGNSGNADNSSDGDRNGRPTDPNGSIVKEGRIEKGVECPVLHTPDGEIWALALGEADFGPGDYVRVTGKRADMSFCQQGEGTIDPSRIDSIEPPARDRDPARAGGIPVTTGYVRGKWAAKGGDCGSPDFQVTTNANGLALIKARVNGKARTGVVDVGNTPELHWDEPIQAQRIETRGPDGLAVMPPGSGPQVTIGGVKIRGDGVVFVKCA